MESALLAAVMSLLLAQVTALATGAPENTCETMNPQHHCKPTCRPPQQGPSPYVTQPDQPIITNGSSLTLTLRAFNTTDTFAGYLLMAFDNATSAVIGQFSNPSSGRFINCFNGFQNAATHSDGTVEKTSVNITWTAPANYSGTVIFKTTFAQTDDKFWVKQESIPVRVNPSTTGGDSSSSSTPSMVTIPSPTMAATTQPSVATTSISSSTMAANKSVPNASTSTLAVTIQTQLNVSTTTSRSPSGNTTKATPGSTASSLQPYFLSILGLVAVILA